MSGLPLGNTRAGVLLHLAVARAPAPAAAAPVCSPTLFIEAASYPAGASVRGIAVADFNGDAKATSPRRTLPPACRFSSTTEAEGSSPPSPGFC